MSNLNLVYSTDCNKGGLESNRTTLHLESNTTTASMLLNTIQCHTVSSASTALNAEKLFCATEYLCTKERILHPAVVVTTACIRCQTFWLSVAKLIRGGGGT